MSGIDASGIDDLMKSLDNTLKMFPEKRKAFHQKAGKIILDNVKKNIKKDTKRKKGSHLKDGIYDQVGSKGGYVVIKADYTGKITGHAVPHAHLYEFGHVQKTADGREVGFVKGKHVFENGLKESEPKLLELVDEFSNGIVRDME